MCGLAPQAPDVTLQGCGNAARCLEHLQSAAPRRRTVLSALSRLVLGSFSARSRLVLILFSPAACHLRVRVMASGSPWPVEAARWMPTGLHGAALC